jgi:hypothetical protein
MSQTVTTTLNSSISCRHSFLLLSYLRKPSVIGASFSHYSVGVGATSPTVACIGMLACTTPRAHDHPYSHSHHSSGASAMSPAAARTCTLVYSLARTYDRSYSPSHSFSPFQLQPRGSHMHLRAHAHAHTRSFAGMSATSPAVARTCTLVYTMARTYDRSYAPSLSLSPFRLQPHRSHMHLCARRSRPVTLVVRSRSLFRSFVRVPFATSSLPPDRIECTTLTPCDTRSFAFVRSFIRSSARSFEFHLPRRHCHPIASISRFKVTWLKGWGT